MRLSVNLDDELYQLAKSVALAENVSISTAINRLLKQLVKRTALPTLETAEADVVLKGRRRFPVSRCIRPITEAELQRAQDDEDLRHWSAGGAA